MPPPASFELAQNHNRMQQELTEKERQIKQLAGVCAEREALIHQLSTICTEREAVIQQLADSRNRNIIRRLADKLSKFMRWQGIA